ncbi:hypothetical protein VCSRO55_0259 [Vibrio cholerae]|uniref:hypothetical protein n=1 Tax=Vibrio cholerae TaxID=666 RepID=UPI0011DAEA81|nr:hypothetical protein [Vibrio cholerae]EGR2496049.1 hypothetical protein [Vibrio cholerae]TXZ51716.1 hypothetical protein FXE54_12640 [Vibrio cholerae]GHW18246.1 hypothetical protein VCSRO55_0259 [Vibrio cholerae]
MTKLTSCRFVRVESRIDGFFDVIYVVFWSVYVIDKRDIYYKKSRQNLTIDFDVFYMSMIFIDFQ